MVSKYYGIIGFSKGSFNDKNKEPDYKRDTPDRPRGR